MIDPIADLPLFQSAPKVRPATKDQFEAFDNQHPDIWNRFCEIALDLIRRGHKHYSCHGILYVIRWHYQTSTSGHDPKINNNYSSFYSRKWSKEFPQHADFFSKRESKADLEAA